MLKTSVKDTIDPVALKEQLDEFEYFLRHPAFESSITFGLEFAMFEERVKRQVRANFQLTPEWPYWDLHLNRENIGRETFSYNLEILAVPEFGTKAERKPGWVAFNILEDGIIPQSIIDRILELAEIECRKIDKSRREHQALLSKPRRYSEQ